MVTYTMTEGNRVIESIGGIKDHLQPLFLVTWHRALALLALPWILAGVVHHEVQELIHLAGDTVLGDDVGGVEEQPGVGLVFVGGVLVGREGDVVGEGEAGADYEAAAAAGVEERHAVVAARELVGGVDGRVAGGAEGCLVGAAVDGAGRRAARVARARRRRRRGRRPPGASGFHLHR